jgi:hypothetical protein
VARNQSAQFAPKKLTSGSIAQHLFQEIDGPVVKFLTKDTKTKETVLDEVPNIAGADGSIATLVS